MTKKYSIEEVLSKVEYKNIKHEFDGISIKMNSQRYQLFKEKGVVCACCGAKGSYFAMVEHIDKGEPTGKFHFNLYTEDGVLMTKDHIVPKSKGGANSLSNYQPMCSICNESKADQM